MDVRNCNLYFLVVNSTNSFVHMHSNFIAYTIVSNSTNIKKIVTASAHTGSIYIILAMLPKMFNFHIRLTHIICGICGRHLNCIYKDIYFSSI